MDIIILLAIPVLIWLISDAYVIYEYVIKPKKTLLEGLKDFDREAEEDEWF